MSLHFIYYFFIGSSVDPETARRVPWTAFFVTPAAFTLLIANFVNHWIYYMILTELPTYLTSQLNYNLEDAGYVSVLPYLAQFLSSLTFGQVFTYVENNHNWTKRKVRQCAQGIAFIGAG